MANSAWISPFGINFTGASVVFTTPALFADGSSALPSAAFASEPTLGLFRPSAQNLGLVTSAGHISIDFGEDIFVFTSTTRFGWTNSATNAFTGALDSGFSRISAGLIGVGTGGAGSFAGGLKLTDLTLARAATLLSTSVALTDQSGAGAGTITNAPSAGNPTKWIAIDDNGTTRKIPTWT